MGGLLEVRTLEDYWNRWYGNLDTMTPQEHSYRSHIPWIPDSLVIEIDFSLKETIKCFKDFFPEAYNIDEEGKRIIKLTQELKTLGDPTTYAWRVRNV